MDEEQERERVRRVDATIDALPDLAPEVDPFSTIGAIGVAVREERLVRDAVRIGRVVERTILSGAILQEVGGTEVMPRVLLRAEILAVLSRSTIPRLSDEPSRMELAEAARPIIRTIYATATEARSVVRLSAVEVVLRDEVARLRRRVGELEAEVADLRPIADRALEAETGTIDWRTER